jgi:hypothetical protein
VSPQALRMPSHVARDPESFAQGIQAGATSHTRTPKAPDATLLSVSIHPVAVDAREALEPSGADRWVLWGRQRGSTKLQAIAHALGI